MCEHVCVCVHAEYGALYVRYMVSVYGGACICMYVCVCENNGQSTNTQRMHAAI